MRVPERPGDGAFGVAKLVLFGRTCQTKLSLYRLLLGWEMSYDHHPLS